jgi:hypothetical protein
MDAQHCVRLLQVALGLPPTGDLSSATHIDHSDFILVSIDFENGTRLQSCAALGHVGSKPCEAGISIFDTRTLSSPSGSPEETFETYNIGLGKHSPSSRRKYNYRFLFGETRWIRLEDLSDHMEQFIDRTRNIILVGHSFDEEKHVLQALGFDLKTSIVGILDTETLANTILGPPFMRGSRRLRNILLQLGCELEGFYSAGNDANFTLRALLLLAVQHYAGLENLDCGTLQRLEKIKNIGHSSIPRRPPKKTLKN